jgi:tetratricopeptide (TPR) repeat protein
MGREHSWQGKYVYLLLACLIFLVLSNCRSVQEVQKPEPAEPRVQDTLPQSPEPVEELEIQDQVIPEEAPKEEQVTNDASHYLLLAQRLMEKGHFEASVDAGQKSLFRSEKKSPGDEALFHMGLIYAHYNNPKKDYKKSIAYFERVVNEYPRSPLAGQAKIWIAVLNIIEQSKQVDIQIEEMKKELLQK